MSIRVFIADDQLLVLAGIRRALEDAEEIEMLGATQHGQEVVPLVDELSPDLVLLDHGMAGAEFARLKHIKERHPEIHVVMLSGSENAVQIDAALSAGATAYIGKRIDPRDLPSALRQIVSGVVYRSAPAVAAAAAPACELTERELTMLDAISRGLSTKMISRELWVSEKTVKFHLTNIYRKLGVHNRAGAMRYALEHDLVAQPRPAQAAVAAG
jgi:DNA-binding NarL/FixJ family response regulator